MITNVARETSTENVGYGVDSLDRITSANASYLTASYAWDLAGNPTLRIENGVTNNCVLTNGNRLVSWAGGTNRFDTAGNVTNIVRGGVNWGLIWNSQYQLTEMRSNNVAVERYGYDALGRRSWTWDGAATNYHLYNGIHVMADVTATGSLIRTYSYSAGIDNLSAITVHTGAVAKTYYCLTDHAGTVHALADNTGAVVKSYRFDPWGRVLGTWNGAGQSIAASAIGNRYLLHGREYSWRTDLYYFRARYFDPQTARWLSKDPLGIAGGANLYQTMNDNVVRFRDPSGNCSQNSSGFWHSFGNALNNTADAIGTAFGAEIYDLTHLSWSAQMYRDAANRLWSTETPVVPSATPYVATALGVSASASIVALVAMTGLNNSRGQSPTPPGWNNSWQQLPGTRNQSGMNWWDSNGGEWRYHQGGDTWHPVPHWDYNPWDSWNSPWQNVP